MGNEEIRQMSRNRFRKITKKKAEDIAYTALLSKKDNVSKGRSLKYADSLQMADYLCPNTVISVEEQQQIFRIKSRVNPLPLNKGEVSLCEPGCESLLENDHILSCMVLNPGEKHNLVELINGSLHEIKKILKNIEY